MHKWFSIQRFRLLLNELWIQNGISFLALCFALLVFHLLVGLLPDSYVAFRPISAFISYFIGVSAILIVIIQKYGGQLHETVSSLLLPASTFEKLWSVIVVVVLFQVVQTFSFLIGDAILINFLKDALSSADISEINKTEQLKKLTLINWNDSVFKVSILFSTLYTVWILTVNSYFTKYRLAKTLVVTILTFGAIYSVNWFLGSITLGTSNSFFQQTPFASTSLEVYHKATQSARHIFLSHTNSQEIILYYVSPTLIIFLGIAYFFKLKETEV